MSTEDAALIAAAPDLYDCLEQIDHALQAVESGVPMSPQAALLLRRIAGVALARARGEPGE